MVKSFLPKAGWAREVERDALGRIVAVTWSGGQLPSGEFDEFCLVARNPAEPCELVWWAGQTDRDGQMTVFGDLPGADPAPVTRIVVEPAP